MFLVTNRVGAHDDLEIWTEAVAAGKLAAYLEQKAQKPPRNTFGEPHFATYVVENFGWNNPSIRVQKATRIPVDPETLFQKPGDQLELAVLPYERAVCDDYLQMTITLVDDSAFANAVAQTTSTLENTGWCALELKLVPEQQ